MVLQERSHLEQLFAGCCLTSWNFRLEFHGCLVLPQKVWNRFNQDFQR